MKLLKNMIGEIVIARIRGLDGDKMTPVKLHAVETGGVWIQSQAFTDAMMERCRVTSSGTTVLLFVPFAAIDFILGSIAELSLSEKALDL